MVILSTKLFCCFALHAFGTARLAKASFCADGNTAKESADLQSLELTSQTIHIAANARLEELTSEERLQQLELTASKEKIATINKKRKQIKRRIELLDTKSNPEYIRLQSQLQQLHHALNPVILERVRRLSGLGPSISAIQFIVTPPQSPELVEASSGESPQARIPNDEHIYLPTIQAGRRSTRRRNISKRFRKIFKFTKFLSCVTASKSNTHDGTLASVDEPLTLADKSTTPGVAHRMSNGGNYPPAIESVGPTNGVSFTGSPTPAFENIPDEPVRKESESGGGYELPEDLVKLVKEHMLTDEMKIWNILQGALMRFQAETLRKEDHKHVVYVVLSTILRHAPWGYRGPSPRLAEIRSEFIRSDFLGNLDGLSPEIIHQKLDEHAGSEFNDHPIVHLIATMTNAFRMPSRNSVRPTKKLDFQMMYYIIDFLEEYYQPIMKAMIPESDPSRALYTKQLDFMSDYLSFYQDQFQERGSYPAPIDGVNHEEMSHRFMLSHHPLDQWVITVSHSIIEHCDFLRGVMNLRPDFTLWMGKKCWKCDHPYRRCEPSCHRFREPEERDQ
ncbi:hypothetical protein MJO29_004068 [Puccinia striiformis f. sp. tritici]|nr:hypothetical protein MJO29_004068 [Puccinia striiformis f. sp. tritici]